MNISHFAVLFLSLWFCPTEQLSCHTSELNICLIPTLLQAEGSLMPRNSSELASACEAWNDAWQCADNYISNCVADVHSMVLKLILQQPRKSSQELCDPTSKLRAAYAKNSPCVPDALTLTLQTCTDNLENVIHMIAGNNAEDGVNALCCYYQRGYQCLKRNTVKLCGNESFVFAKEALRFFHIDTLNSICKSYDPEDNVCVDYLNRIVPAPTDSVSYLARLAVQYLRFLQ